MHETSGDRVLGGKLELMKTDREKTEVFLAERRDWEFGYDSSLAEQAKSSRFRLDDIGYFNLDQRNDARGDDMFQSLKGPQAKGLQADIAKGLTVKRKYQEPVPEAPRTPEKRKGDFQIMGSSAKRVRTIRIPSEDPSETSFNA
ncbi:hypothetical protein SLS58_010464 [Diplodia intermedia]|uniref:Uncharacterized protein n=1 Tax=Diplodia intermedia TaxID=856260 RepID=A0ABR3T668_9PEZI